MTSPSGAQPPVQAPQEPRRVDDGPFVPPAPLLPGERAADQASEDAPAAAGDGATAQN